MTVFSVAFFGHRYIDSCIEIEKKLDLLIESLIHNKEYVEFLVGRSGDFDRYVSSAVRRSKKRNSYDNIFLELILPYPTAEYKNNTQYFEKYYDGVEVCQASAKAHFKSAIQIRNQEMVKRADLIICYVEHKSGGAYQTIRYAQKKNKNIINLANLI